MIGRWSDGGGATTKERCLPQGLLLAREPPQGLWSSPALGNKIESSRQVGEALMSIPKKKAQTFLEIDNVPGFVSPSW